MPRRCRSNLLAVAAAVAVAAIYCPCCLLVGRGPPRGIAVAGCRRRDSRTAVATTIAVGFASVARLALHYPGLAALPVVLVVVAARDQQESDLYKILGVSKTATTKQIKQAYRRKAKDTHPDKNQDVPPEEAAQAFHKVVHAFEVLSDDSSRSRYDRTGDASADGGSRGGGGGASGYGGGGGGYHGNFQWFFHSGYRRQRVRLKDKFEVQQAQSRVLHVVSLEQLRTIMLDDDDRLERHLLMCFVVPGDVEKQADVEMVFPYPFAHMSEQGIWWEDLLQTVLVRFHNKGNSVTKFFNIPSGDEMRESGKPIFLFGNRGDELLPENFHRLQTSDRQEFETWTWKQIEVMVYFRNEHAYPVEVYWIHGNRAHIKSTIPPGDTLKHKSMLTHEFYVRDARVDAFGDSPGRWKLSENSSLGSWKIGVEGEEGSPPIRDDGTIEIVIQSKNCMDLSGHCSFWKGQGECQKVRARD